MKPIYPIARPRHVRIDDLDVRLLTCQPAPGPELSQAGKLAVLHVLAPSVRLRAALCWRWECRERPYAEAAPRN